MRQFSNNIRVVASTRVLVHSSKRIKLTLLLLIVALIYTLLWYRSSCLTIGGDFVFTFYPSRELARYTYSYNWFNEIGGSAPYSISSAFALTDTLIMAFWQVSFGLDIYSANFMYVLTLTFVSACSMYFLASTAFSDDKQKVVIGLLAVLAWLYSPWAIMDTYKSLVANLLRLDQSAFILSLALLMRLGKERRYYYALIIGLLSWTMLEVFPVDAYRFFVLLISAYIAATIYFVLSEPNKGKIKTVVFFMKAFCIMILAVIFVNLWRILPFINYFLSHFETVNVLLPVGSWNQESTMLNALRIVNAWGFSEYTPYANTYLNNPIVIASTFFLPLLVFGALLQKRRRKILYVTLIAIVALFLSKGENAPFGEVFVSLVNFGGPLYPFKAFHGTGAFTMRVLTILYALLSAYTIHLITTSLLRKFSNLSSKVRHLTQTTFTKHFAYVAVASAVFAPMIVSAYPLVTGEVLENWWLMRAHQEKSYGVIVPEDYFQASDILERDIGAQPLLRALLLPQPQTYVATSWGYQGTAAFYNRFFGVTLITSETVGYGAYQFKVDPWSIPLKMENKIDIIQFAARIVPSQNDSVTISTENLVWKIVTSNPNVSNHDLFFEFETEQDFQEYTHIVLNLRVDTIDLSRLLVGVSDVKGYVGWYTSAKYIDQQKDNVTFSLHVPVKNRPEISTFDRSIVNGVILRYLSKAEDSRTDPIIQTEGFYAAQGAPDFLLWAKMLSLLSVKDLIVDKSIESGATTNHVDYLGLLTSDSFEKLFESNNLLVFRNILNSQPVHLFSPESVEIIRSTTILKNLDLESSGQVDFLSMHDDSLRFSICSNNSAFVLVFSIPYENKFDLSLETDHKISVRHIDLAGFNAWTIEGWPINEQVYARISFHYEVYRMLFVTGLLMIVLGIVVYVGRNIIGWTRTWRSRTGDGEKWEMHAESFVYADVFRPFSNHIVALKDKYRPRVCLDVACGDGRFMDKIAEDTDLTLGLDISRNRLRRAKVKCARMPNIGFILADASHFPFRESCIDGIFMIELLEHVTKNNRPSILSATREVSRGFVLATLPNPLAHHAHLDPTHILDYSVETLRRQLRGIFKKHEILVAGSHIPYLKTDFWHCNKAMRNMLKCIPYASTSFICFATGRSDRNDADQTIDRWNKTETKCTFTSYS